MSQAGGVAIRHGTSTGRVGLKHVSLLQGGRDKGAVKGQLQDWLVTDDVVASSAQTMEDTLRYLDSRYGGASLALMATSGASSSADLMLGAVASAQHHLRGHCTKGIRTTLVVPASTWM